MARYLTGNKEINLPFPTQKYSSYMEVVGGKKENTLRESQINHIFKLMVVDFLAGEISVDDISSICNILFDRTAALNRKYPSELFDAIIAGSELGFYVRDPKLSSQFNSFLKEILEYGEGLKESL